MNREVYIFIQEITDAIFYFKILPIILMIGGFVLLFIAVIIHYIKSRKGRTIIIMDETANFPKDK